MIQTIPFSTADLCDDHGDLVQVADPIFRDFGGVTGFSGPIATVRVFDDNTSVRALLETPGAGRVLVVGETLRAHLPAHQVPVVDTTAAGDAFVGGFAVALVHGLPLLDAVRWGNAAGALAVTRAGAQPSLPTRAEIDALLAQSGTH